MTGFAGFLLKAFLIKHTKFNHLPAMMAHTTPCTNIGKSCVVGLHSEKYPDAAQQG